MNYLFLLLIIFGINLLPAFGPPTWLALVIAQWRWHLNPVAVVLLGVIGAVAGRGLLAVAFGRLRDFFPKRYVNNLNRAHAKIDEHPSGEIAWYIVFLFTPVPSAQLFCAVGLLEMPLTKILITFAVGRLVSYAIYDATASAIGHEFHSLWSKYWGNPFAIALQISFLIGLSVLPLISWKDKGSPPEKPSVDGESA
ncbi:MAG: hypothetical protein WCG18_00520 [Acidimicrobiaceae bacterium]